MNLVASPPSEQLATAEITATSFYASPAGGGVLIGRDERGALRRAVIGAAAMTRDPAPGETWRVTGAERAHIEYGLQIHARVALPLLPTGRAVVRYLATNTRFPGIGWATATRLWDTLGERLYAAIRQRDLRAVAEVIGAERAVAVVQGFGMLAEETEVFEWLDRYGVSPRTAAAAAAIWGREAIQKIEADPYVLSLLESWRAVDNRALRLGL